MSQEVDILCITAHPDDAELSCSGTIVKHIAMGHRVGLVDLTAGELGTRGNAEIRKKESEKALEVLGAEFRYQLGLPDGFFEVEKKSLMTVIGCIRKHRPRIILTNAVRDRHPDHGMGGRLVARAAFLAGLRKIDTGQKAHRPLHVLHAVQDRYIDPDIVVDISPYFDRKMESIKAFASQFYDPESNEPDSPISSKEFMDFVEGRALQFGRLIGVRYGEGFVSDRTMAVNDLFDLI